MSPEDKRGYLDQQNARVRQNRETYPFVKERENSRHRVANISEKNASKENGPEREKRMRYCGDENTPEIMRW